MPDTGPDCYLCQDTGWITCVDTDGESAYYTACPEGCPVPVQPLDDQDQHQEVPF